MVAMVSAASQKDADIASFSKSLADGIIKSLTWKTNSDTRRINKSISAPKNNCHPQYHATSWSQKDVDWSNIGGTADLFFQEVVSLVSIASGAGTITTNSMAVCGNSRHPPPQQRDDDDIYDEDDESMFVKILSDGGVDQGEGGVEVGEEYMLRQGYELKRV